MSRCEQDPIYYCVCIAVVSDRQSVLCALRGGVLGVFL